VPISKLPHRLRAQIIFTDLFILQRLLEVPSMEISPCTTNEFAETRDTHMMLFKRIKDSERAAAKSNTVVIVTQNYTENIIEEEFLHNSWMKLVSKAVIGLASNEHGSFGQKPFITGAFRWNCMFPVVVLWIISCHNAITNKSSLTVVNRVR
jgi:hypothetical protein